jgi:broad specificity phosphatase PhoE
LRLEGPCRRARRTSNVEPRRLQNFVSTLIYLIRHGAYDHRPSPQGTEASCDFGLSELGRAQAGALSRRLAQTSEIKADHLFSSTLPRAVQTAEALSTVLRQSPIAMQELCEWESGNEVMGNEAFMARFNGLRGAERRNYRFATGFETIAEFTERVHAKLGELTRRHEDQSLVMVVHGGVVEAAFHYFLGFGPGPFEGGYPAAGHCSITLWKRSGSREDWVQMFANDTHHLRSSA